MEIQYPVVNDSDVIVGMLSKKDAYERRAMLRSVQIFLFDCSGRLLVQRRALTKLRFPGYYCASVAGHVEPGESYEDAAKRELKEEIGVIESLTFLIKEKTPIGENEYAMMAHFCIVSDSPIVPQKEELCDAQFFIFEEIEEMIKKGELFTPSFLFSFQRLKKGCI